MTDAEAVGVVALAFGLERDEPSKCNRRIAALTRRRIQHLVAAGYRVLPVSEWEVTLALGPEIEGVRAADWVSVGLHPEGQTEADVEEAVKLFARASVSQVEVIAQAWLQWPYVWRLLRRHGYRVRLRYPGWIGYNRRSDQWRDHSSAHLLVYMLLELCKGRLRRSKH
jgi:hypothetical protein